MIWKIAVAHFEMALFFGGVGSAEVVQTSKVWEPLVVRPLKVSKLLIIGS